jgi:hypothetical protein
MEGLNFCGSGANEGAIVFGAKAGISRITMCESY